MRAAAILGPGNITKAVATFQRLTGSEWTSLIEQADIVVIFGGDGTIHRHLSELVELEIPVLVVPCGSGNDFARALGIRSLRDAVTAWKKFVATGEAHSIDLGMISPAIAPRLKPSDQEQPVSMAKTIPFLVPAKSYFCCVAGVGIDTAIARSANNLPRWLRARGGYALSASREFIRYAPFPMRVSRNGTQSAEFRPTLLAAAANTPTYGGGMKIAPQAQLSDGKLDLCVIDSMNVFRLFCLFPTVFFGRHLGIKQVRYEQTEHIRIETESPLDIYADGEYICQTPVEITVAHNALKVIAP